MSIGQNGLEIETHEKHNVMTSGMFTSYIFIICSSLLLVIAKILWVQIIGAIGFLLTLLCFFFVFIFHSFKNPELLQSEKYRLEKMQTEAMLFENKYPIEDNSTQIETNIIPVLVDNGEDKE